MGAILSMSLGAALLGGGVVASYQPTPAKAHGVILAAFLISFVPAVLEGPGKSAHGDTVSKRLNNKKGEQTRECDS
jgi:hypothetical protein